MLRIGLTGGIGSGKSTVCKFFAELGSPIIDTDKIAHDLVAPGQPALEQLVSSFGGDILNQQGRLNRSVLRSRVFRNETERLKLESILHPLIRQQLRQELEALHSSYVIIAIPLLLEKDWQTEVDRILVVDIAEDQQIARTSKRDGMTRDEVMRIMQSQATRQQRLAAADDIIHNDGSPDALKDQVRHLHLRYSQLADTTDC